MLGRSEPHFSFAGLKTAVRHQAQALVPLREPTSPTCAPSSRRRSPIAWPIACGGPWRSPDERLARRARHLVVAGGVAANMRAARGPGRRRAQAGYALHVPPAALCTDNAAMVAWAGAERLARGMTDGLDLEARARWPLDPDAAPALGAGRQGAKA